MGILEKNSADVVIIGAGLAGLTAAYELARNGKDVLVLEKEDEVGGRNRSFDVDGFTVDGGFQLINPAYPALREVADVRALDLRAFGSGVEVLRSSGSVKRLAHPVFHPNQIPQSLASGLLSVRDVVGLTRFVVPALKNPREALDSVGSKEGDYGSATLGAVWDELGITGKLRTEAFTPFLRGVVADDAEEIAADVAQFLMAVFVLGKPSLPSRGAGTLSRQLADKARRAGATITTGVEVDRIEPKADRSVVRVGATGMVTASSVIVAVGPEVAGTLTGSGASGDLDSATPTRGLATWWFRADEAPSNTRFVRIGGSGPVINTAVVTNIAPSYSPDTSAIIEASTLLGSGEDPSKADVIKHVSQLWGTDASTWDIIMRTDVPHSLPNQRPPHRTAGPIAVAEKVVATGDYRISGSIQGAIEAGLDAVAAV